MSVLNFGRRWTRPVVSKSTKVLICRVYLAVGAMQGGRETGTEGMKGRQAGLVGPCRAFLGLGFLV